MSGNDVTSDVTSDVIDDVSVTFLSIPLEKPLLTAAFPIPAIDTALVQIQTRGGHTGIAWSFAFGRGRVASLVRLIEDLGDLVIGRHAVDTEALWASMSKASGFIGRRGLAALALSAIDTACWDIKGKVAGLPVYRLLGGYRNSLETYASQGLWLDRSRTALADEAAELVASGFHAVKMRAGLSDENEDVARVAAVRDAIGPDVKLMVDANQAWDLKATLRMADRLAPYDLFWLKEPMPHEQIADYVIARNQIPMALCTGESNYLKDEILRLVQSQAADIAMPDLMRMGGVTEWVKAAHICESFQTLVTPHLFMEHSTHLAAACANVVWQEFQPWWQPIMATPIELVDGEIVLPETPGFGIELDERALKAFQL